MSPGLFPAWKFLAGARVPLAADGSADRRRTCSHLTATAACAPRLYKRARCGRCQNPHELCAERLPEVNSVLWRKGLVMSELIRLTGRCAFQQRGSSSISRLSVEFKPLSATLSG
jgi:hypothetical protein